MSERILILDFGSQFTQLITRRIREAGVYCEILPCTVEPERIEAFGAKAIILSGGNVDWERTEEALRSATV